MFFVIVISNSLQNFYIRKKFNNPSGEVKNIEWGNRCYQNIAKYLLGLNKKAGILAKPCDARAIVQYITEQQIKRENVFIIGVDCTGMIDENGLPHPGCADCRVHTPPVYDEYIHDKRFLKDEECPKAQPSAGNTGSPPLADDLPYNFEKFQKEIDKCILCFACRQACYGCYCKECFIDRDLPDWRPGAAGTGIHRENNSGQKYPSGTKMTFHMGRTMHLAGRCIECGACEASCQSGVNVRYIIKNLSRFIEELYGYSAGMDVNQKPALLANEFDDREVGFLKGKTHV